MFISLNGSPFSCNQRRAFLQEAQEEVIKSLIMMLLLSF
ncbi:hypothetical protein P7266_1512 [Lactococcus cremoris]|nr:hypothetical protein P7266_1512 [Lactococcus cremoris]